MTDMKALPLKPCLCCNGSGEVYDHEAIGAVMRKVREDAKLSLREIARRLHLSAPYVSDLELGRRNWTRSRIADFENACSDVFKPKPQFKL